MATSTNSPRKLVAWRRARACPLHRSFTSSGRWPWACPASNSLVLCTEISRWRMSCWISTFESRSLTLEPPSSPATRSLLTSKKWAPGGIGLHKSMAPISMTTRWTSIPWAALATICYSRRERRRGRWRSMTLPIKIETVVRLYSWKHWSRRCWNKSQRRG